MADIRAADLVHSFAPDKGVCGLNLAVEPGTCAGVLGRNGSGKSTLTSLLAGLRRPQSGELEVLGRPPFPRNSALLIEMGVALDQDAHWEDLSGWANAEFCCSVRGMEPDLITPNLDRLFGLADLTEAAHEPVKTYSFGMRRKLTLIRGLAPEPRVLLLDEPTNGLDFAFKAELTGLIRERSEAGLTTWAASNDPGWLARTCDRVLFIDSGRIAAQGSPAELVGAVEDRSTVTLTVTGPVTEPDFPGLVSLAQEGDRLTVLLEPDPGLVPRLLEAIQAQGVLVSQMEVASPGLAEAYLRATGREVGP